MTTTERPATMCEAFQRTAAIDPDAVALRTPGGTQTLTWREYAAQVRRVAAGLAGLGVRRGDTVSLMMANRIEFYPLEVGAQHVGATSFSVYNTLPAEQLTYLFDNAGTKVAICEEQYVDRIRASGAPIEHIVCIDGSPPGTLSVDDLYAAAAADFDFEAAWRAVQPDDIVTLIYTSGTTGNPKGVEMTHTNLLFEGYGLDAVLGIQFGDRITSFLPSAHIADRMTALYGQEMFGTQITVVSDGRAIAAALPDVRPTVWGAVPRVWEKLKAGIEFTVSHETDDAKRQAMQWAMSVAAKRGRRPARRRADVRRSRRRVGQGRRVGAVEAAGAARLFRTAVGALGRGADPQGDAGLLRRHRHPDRRGLGNVRAELRRHRHAIPATRAWAPSASCFPGWRARSPTTASIWSAARW